MATNKKVYTNTKNGQPLLSTISSGCKTPVLEIRFCNLVNAFRYPNSPTIPRYSVTCVVDPEEHKEFLEGIQSIEKAENVETILKHEYIKEDGKTVTTGKLLVKFQGKAKIPLFILNENNDEEPLELVDELEKGEKVQVIYEILRYTKKNSFETEHGLSFRPTKIYYFPSKSNEQNENEEE